MPYFLRPDGINVSIHRFMNRGDSWPDDVCWEVDVNGGYDYAQLVRDRSICGPLAAAERARDRRNDGSRDASPGSRDDDAPIQRRSGGAVSN
jgi:hypothetical protein